MVCVKNVVQEKYDSMKSKKQILEKLEEEKAEANRLLSLSNASLFDNEKNMYLRQRTPVTERIISLEWVLGISEC